MAHVLEIVTAPMVSQTVRRALTLIMSLFVKFAMKAMQSQTLINSGNPVMTAIQSQSTTSVKPMASAEVSTLAKACIVHRAALAPEERAKQINLPVGAKKNAWNAHRTVKTLKAGSISWDLRAMSTLIWDYVVTAGSKIIRMETIPPTPLVADAVAEFPFYRIVILQWVLRATIAIPPHMATHVQIQADAKENNVTYSAKMAVATKRHMMEEFVAAEDRVTKITPPSACALAAVALRSIVTRASVMVEIATKPDATTPTAKEAVAREIAI